MKNVDRPTEWQSAVPVLQLHSQHSTRPAPAPHITQTASTLLLLQHTVTSIYNIISVDNQINFS